MPVHEPATFIGVLERLFIQPVHLLRRHVLEREDLRGPRQRGVGVEVATEGERQVEVLAQIALGGEPVAFRAPDAVADDVAQRRHAQRLALVGEELPEVPDQPVDKGLEQGFVEDADLLWTDLQHVGSLYRTAPAAPVLEFRAMPTRHVVQAGDSVLSLAEEHGLFAATIWDDPANSELKKKRSNMNVLMPDEDVVVIPDKRERVESRETGALYKFRRKGIPALLRMQIRQYGQPQANVAFTLTVDGQEQTGTTDDQGMIEVYVSALAKEGELVLGENEVMLELQFGHMDPVKEITGVQKRLYNLGYYQGEADGELGEETAAALRAFQESAGLEVTGEADDATREKLREAHDSAKTGDSQG